VDEVDFSKKYKDEWIPFALTQEETLFFLNAGRSKRNGDLVTIWTQFKLNKDQIIETSQSEINCKVQTSRYLFRVIYMTPKISAGGKKMYRPIEPIDRHTPDSKPRPIVPDTIGEKKMVAACKL